MTAAGSMRRRRVPPGPTLVNFRIRPRSGRACRIPRERIRNATAVCRATDAYGPTL